MDRKVAGLPMACFHNPEVGRESRELHVAPNLKQVMVVGAGPAGLKAAEVAARRGHRVTVFESTAEPGGRLRHVRNTSARTLFESVSWLIGELASMGVEVHCNTRLTADDISRESPDVVVVATGAVPSLRGVEFDQGPPVLSIDEALYIDAGKTIVVFDQNGTTEAALVAEELAARGHRVTFVTPFELMAPYAGYTHRQDLRSAFHERSVTVVASANVQRGSDRAVAIVDHFGSLRARVAADYLVWVNAPVPQVELVEPLDSLSIAYRVIGDACTARGVRAAMRDADAAARMI